MRALLRAMALRPSRRQNIVVGGSIGKGTTGHYLAQLLRAGGSRVGFYSGPHLHSWRERFTVGEQCISAAEFSQQAHELLDLATKITSSPSSFEWNTALALRWFSAKAVDFAIYEAGIGGRYDAVNAIPHDLTLLTPIEREHGHLLGGSLAAIAAHKAGLIANGGYAISAAQEPSVAAVLRATALERGATLEFMPQGSEEPFTVARALAMAAFQYLRPAQPLPTVALYSLPGRYEWHEQGGQRWLLDGGHTARAGQELARFLSAIGPRPTRIRLILAMLRDKEPANFLAPFLSSWRPSLILTTVYGARALSAAELRARLGPVSGSVLDIREAASPQEAIEMASNAGALTLVTGSLRLVASAREELGALNHAELIEAQRTRALLTAGAGQRMA